jgi:hypothetical protein
MTVCRSARADATGDAQTAEIENSLETWLWRVVNIAGKHLPGQKTTARNFC